MFADYSLSDPLSHFAAEEDKARIKSSKIRQPLTSSSLEARRLINALVGFIIFYLTSLVRRAGACLVCFCEIRTEIFHE